MVDFTSSVAGLMRISAIVEPFARAAVVNQDGAEGYGMRVVEGDGVGRGPQARRRIDQRVRAQRILWEQRLRHRSEVDGRLLPAVGKAAMPKREVAQYLDLPHAFLADIVVLVDSAFPPGARLAFGRLVQAGLHHRAAADLRGSA